MNIYLLVIANFVYFPQFINFLRFTTPTHYYFFPVVFSLRSNFQYFVGYLLIEDLR